MLVKRQASTTPYCLLKSTRVYVLKQVLRVRRRCRLVAMTAGKTKIQIQIQIQIQIKIKIKIKIKK